MKKAFNLNCLIVLLIVMRPCAPAAVLAQSEVDCDSGVVVQANDWLSKLAEVLWRSAGLSGRAGAHHNTQNSATAWLRQN